MLAEINWELSLARVVLYPSPLLCFTGRSISDHGEPGPGVWWVHDGRIVLETGPGQPLSCTHGLPSGLALLAAHPLQRQWGCVRLLLVFWPHGAAWGGSHFPFFSLCFKQGVPTATLTNKTVPVVGGSVDMGKQNSIAWKCLCLQPAAPVLDKAQQALGLCLSTGLSLAVEPGV